MTFEDWQPIETAPANKAVLIFYKNQLGKGRIIKAKFTPRWTVPSDDCGESDGCEEYSEDHDQYFYIESWWELIDNWDEYTQVTIHEKPTHWMPLPKPPVC